MTTFCILAIPIGGDREIEVCRCDGHPDQMVRAVREKTIGKNKIKKFHSVRAIQLTDENDHADPI